jgi:hypothetical protein
VRATKAYIASLGTTGVLLGASILMLAVVSAVVAFDRWPDSHVSTRVQTLVIEDRPAAIRVSDDATGPSATAAAAAGVTAAVRGTAVPVTTAPLQRVAGEQLGGAEGGSPPAGGSPDGANPAAPVPAEVPDPTPIFNAISHPDTTAGRVADGAETLAAGLGLSLNRVSPELGVVVSETGKGAADAVRAVPLPDTILP